MSARWIVSLQAALNGQEYVATTILGRAREGGGSTATRYGASGQVRMQDHPEAATALGDISRLPLGESPKHLSREPDDVSIPHYGLAAGRVGGQTVAPANSLSCVQVKMIDEKKKARLSVSQFGTKSRRTPDFVSSRGDSGLMDTGDEARHNEK
ncbi:hypothetical protein K438DRAFT_1772826 [Mycena galopus ATCC 62051]|nr:hypothetical protein K438DRAFT_1772826 [Mycena galopus ATCC 62051]